MNLHHTTMNLHHKRLVGLLGCLVLGAGCGGDGNNDTPDATMDAAMDASVLTPTGFRSEAPTAYTRVDRMGMPAVSTALVGGNAQTPISKNQYNDGSPKEDVMGTYQGELLATLQLLVTALSDDLTGLGLTPCADATACATQLLPGTMTPVASLVVPDVLKLQAAAPAGFPNGRKLTDPVIDVTLAVLFLDLSVNGPATLASLPLNPPANDVAFDAAFPYLAAPHAP